MPTPAYSPIEKNLGTTCSITEQPKDTRQIVREEIKRAKDLEKLEEQYKSGEISAFEYKAGKFLLTAPLFTDDNLGTAGAKFATPA
ncbi:MAG: hypothetical protein LUH05_06300 [Candidatus Gastranaerophilales bacterium]|nr:hypothetical protein [Candidatus Gastranaerophilales bacterium]